MKYVFIDNATIIDDAFYQFSERNHVPLRRFTFCRIASVTTFGYSTFAVALRSFRHQSVASVFGYEAIAATFGVKSISTTFRHDAFVL
jgi:Zn-dependent protease